MLNNQNIYDELIGLYDKYAEIYWTKKPVKHKFK